MPYETGTATDYLDLLDRVRRFAAGYGVITSESFTGTGNGTLEALGTTPATVTETWTIECTDASTEGAEVWSVTGSVSGAQPDVTTGVDYANDYLAFRIEAGSTAFAVGDTFTVDVEQGTLSSQGVAWAEHRWQTVNTTERELILEGPGASGTDEIFVGIRSMRNEDDDIHNWRLNGFTGYAASEAWELQPGRIGFGSSNGDRALLLWNDEIPYWLVVSGRRILLVARISNTYQAMYLGYMLPYALPNQWGYPLVIAGTTDRVDNRWSWEDENHHNFWNPSEGLALRSPGGPWEVFTQNGDDAFNDRHVWPIAHETGGAPDGPDWIRSAWDGTRPVLPLILFSEPESAVFGELDGAFWTSGESASPEDTVSIGGVDHLMVTDIYRAGVGQYGLIALE